MVLSVSRLAQPQNDAPAAVSVIDQDMIRASGFRDIPDLLRLVPGFSVAYTRDNSWAVGYHGVADAFSRRFQVLVDGRSIYNPAYGSVNWTELPLSIDDVERIEVVRGPNAATYGANAFFAVINIVSKHASQTPGTFASVQYGEQGMAGTTLRHGGGTGDLRYRFTFSRQSRDRFETDIVDNNGPEELYERSHTSVLSGRADYRLSATDEVSAQFGLTKGDWRAGRFFSAEEPTEQDVTSQFVQFKFRRSLNADDEWMVQAYFSRNDLDAPNQSAVCVDNNNGNIVACPGGVPQPPRYTGIGIDVEAGIDVLQTRANLEFLLNRRLSPDWRLSMGGDWRHESATSVRYFNTREKLEGSLARAFANLEWRAHPRWLLQGGAMLEHHYFTGTDISPRVAVNYSLADDHTLRLNVSQAYRSPTFFEQKGDLAYFSTTGILLEQVFSRTPVDLKPERILSREIGYVGRYAPGNLQWDVKLFRDTVYDSIDNGHVNNDRDLPLEFRNRGEFQLQGGDIQASWHPVREFRLNVQYARVFIETGAGVDTDVGLSAPHNQYSVLARYDWDSGWSASAGIYRSSDMKWLSDGDATQAYTRVDLRLARRWSWQGREVEAAVVGQNLGEDYAEFRDTNIFSRRVYGSLSFAW